MRVTAGVVLELRMPGDTDGSQFEQGKLVVAVALVFRGLDLVALDPRVESERVMSAGHTQDHLGGHVTISLEHIASAADSVLLIPESDLPDDNSGILLATVRCLRPLMTAPDTGEINGELDQSHGSPGGLLGKALAVVDIVPSHYRILSVVKGPVGSGVYHLGRT